MMSYKAVLAMLCIAIVHQSAAWTCRMDKQAQHSYCGLPYALSNFQGRPKTLQQLASMVATYPRVKGVGVGHSWHGDLFCAGADNSSINIVLTDLDNVLPLSIVLDAANDKTYPTTYPISVNPQQMTVTVAAGVTQRVLLDYLAAYPVGSGFTLAAFSWFLDQTVAGAVSTATHGSSMRYGSLSSQMTAMDLLLANGTTITLSAADTNPAAQHLWRAACVGVGRLGIITSVTFRIVPQRAIQRTRTEYTLQEFADMLLELTGPLTNTTTTPNTPTSQNDILTRLDAMQAFWFVPTNTVWVIEYDHVDEVDNVTTLVTAPPMLQGQSGGPSATEEQAASVPSAPTGTFQQMPTKPVPPSDVISLTEPEAYSRIMEASLRPQTTPGTYAARTSVLSMTEAANVVSSTQVPYDQYEVAIPLAKAGACFQALQRAVYDTPPGLWQGFRTPPLIRFLSGEGAYVSPAHGGPVVYINLEDYLRVSLNKSNEEFMSVMRLLRGPSCGGRLHWGKAGWDTLAPCFDGAQEYPSTWCHFGCAVQQLDPTDKFTSASDVWNFKATRGGQPVPFASCCGPTGFDYARCTCAPRACVAAGIAG